MLEILLALGNTLHTFLLTRKDITPKSLSRKLHLFRSRKALQTFLPGVSGCSIDKRITLPTSTIGILIVTNRATPLSSKVAMQPFSSGTSASSKDRMTISILVMLGPEELVLQMHVLVTLAMAAPKPAFQPTCERDSKLTIDRKAMTMEMGQMAMVYDPGGME